MWIANLSKCAISIFFRQTNAIWVIFILGVAIVKRIEQKHLDKSASQSPNNFFQVLRLFWLQKYQIWVEKLQKKKL